MRTAIASEDDEVRNEGCAKLAEQLRAVVTEEEKIIAKNEAFESGNIGVRAPRSPPRFWRTGLQPAPLCPP